MKTRKVQFSNGMAITINQMQGKQIVRAFELLAIADPGVALTLLSLETGMTESSLSVAVEIAEMMHERAGTDTASFSPWIQKSEYFPLV